MTRPRGVDKGHKTDLGSLPDPVPERMVSYTESDPKSQSLLVIKVRFSLRTQERT